MNCPYCGSDRVEPFHYKEGWKYCPDCDEPLEPGSVIEQSDAPEEGKEERNNDSMR